ncbi:hypothetical protein SESBI_44844 [Sesbania bispinosa]|nr:hypothetical protein SESBI_44844 [Sesbania bispinosa]
MSVCPSHHQYMKQLVTVSSNVKFPWHPSFWNPSGINQCSNSIESTHQNLITSCMEHLRLAPEQKKLVQNRCYTRQTHSKKEGCTNGAEFWSLKDWKKRNQYGGDTQ